MYISYHSLDNSSSYPIPPSPRLLPSISGTIQSLRPFHKGIMRRLSLPQTPQSTPIFGIGPSQPFASHIHHNEPRRQLPSRPSSLASLLDSPPIAPRRHARLSQPDLFSNINKTEFRNGLVKSEYPSYPNLPSLNNSPHIARSRNGGGKHNLPRRFLKRANQSDLSHRLQRHHDHIDDAINTTIPSSNREHTEGAVDPVYLALKQATGKYGGRRGSSAHNFDSATPSPKNLSQVSLQDSGYVDMNPSRTNPMLGSTPQLDNTGRSTGRRRAPKLSTQMKSLSLDCQDMPPRINSANRSPIRSKLAIRGECRGTNGSSDLSDRSCSPCTVNSRRSSTATTSNPSYIVIHEYAPAGAVPLVLGERLRVIDNGDPDWLHGFRSNDRTENFISFPATCVAVIMFGEQPMRILQNVFVSEQKLRLYRDQIVFAQPDSLCEGKVTVRTEHNAYVLCPLNSLSLI